MNSNKKNKGSNFNQKVHKSTTNKKPIQEQFKCEKCQGMKRVVCPDCYGKGYKGKRACSKCGGVNTILLTVSGSGFVTCKICHGKGHVFKTRYI